MMYSTFRALFISLVFPLSIYAQDWSVLYSTTDTLHFEGAYQIMVSLYADSTSQVGNKRIIYPYKELEWYDAPIAGCDGTTNGDSWCGGQIVEMDNRTHFIFNQDTLTISRTDSVTNCTVKNVPITILNMGASTETMLDGTTDSVFLFSIQTSFASPISSCLNGYAIKLSKTHGLISFPACFKEYSIYSPSSTTIRAGQVSRQVYASTKAADFFNYAVGDVLHYTSFTNGGSSNHSSGRYWVSRVVAKTNTPQGVTYTFVDTGYTSNPVNGTLWFKNTASVSYLDSQYGFKPTGCNNPGASSKKARIVINRLAGDELQTICNFSCVNGTCVNSWCFATVGQSTNFLYLRNVGLVKSDATVYMGYPTSTDLVYYSINGQTWGTPHSFYIDINENSLPRLNVYPNPASDFLTIKGYSEHKNNVKYSIQDLSGRTILSNNINHGEERIWISTLKKGTYILDIEGYMPLKFVKE